MSSKPYTLKIEAETKQFQGRINLDWDVYTMATWDATIYPAENLDGFDLVSIERSGVEIFGGRVEKPVINFSRGGRAMPTSGFDHTVRLRDYKTPLSTTIAGTTTVAALGSILVETPFNISTTGTFEYITDLKSWDTWLEMVTDIEVFTDVTVELDISEVEISDLVNAGTWTGCNYGLRSTFFYDGTTQRFYVFVKNAANDLYYYHSTDGDTWTGVDTGFNPSGDAWSVAWYDSKVYLFYYDGANTDFARGTITDATGTITFGVTTGNIFANDIIFGPVFDDSNHIWVVRNSGGGIAYESTDDGLTFNNTFGPGANELHGILPVGSDGDMYGFELDTVNSDLEEWLWDRSAGTYTFVAKIANENDVDTFEACSDADYNPYIIWEDGNDVFYSDKLTGVWLNDAVGTFVAFNTFTVSCDGYRNIYIAISYGGGVDVYKWINGSKDSENTGISTYTNPIYLSSPRGYLQDGQIAVYFAPIHSTDFDPYMLAFSEFGLRLVEAATSGTIRTETVASTGAFTSWGVCSASGNDDLDDTLWNILDTSNVELITDQLPNFDMKLAGVPSTETSVKVTIDFDGVGNDPVVYEFSVTERTDTVTIMVDGETAYNGVQRLADLAGAEFWVTKDNGTYTVNFSTRRGSDKSSYIILKCATTSDEPDVNANIKVLTKTFDYTDFANAIQFIGGLDTNGDRIEVSVRDTSSITTRGQEYWFTLRDASVTTNSMGRTLATLELNSRNAVVQRLAGEFVDKYDSGAIEIGDSVYLIGEWQDGELKIDGSFRIVALKRSWGVGGGERVSAQFSNRLKPVQYYNYIKKVDDLEVISTQ